MYSFAQAQTENSNPWDSQPSDAAWVSVRSLSVIISTAETGERVWTPAHLCSKWEEKKNTFGSVFPLFI